MRRTLLAMLATAFVFQLPGGDFAEAGDSAEVTATVRANPVSVTLFLSSATISVGWETSAVAQVDNAGPSPLTDVSVTLHVQPDGVAAVDGFDRLLGVIGSTETASTTWDLCGLLPGNYVLLARATATMADGAVVETDSNARLLEVTARGRKPCGKAYR